MAREEGFFDELARGLADGSLTRGKALRLMGAALLGGTLGSLGIREASADRPGCKRAGKHCTRTDQCCGDLVCLSGTCQTPTTTTTETPTTTTTETPTTTTTETPTTTTTETPTTTTSTTTCSGRPNGASCNTSTDCCSGNCQNGSCLPPTGPNLTHCVCADNVLYATCTSVACGPALLTLVCDPLCATLGGRLGYVDCFPESATCAG
jgi:hypothetical protein